VGHGIMKTRHAHNDSTANATCPTCQGNENMRREIDDEADAAARKRFRLFVVLYLVYPFVILSLLAVIGAGAYTYLNGNPGGDDYAGGGGPQPPWCYPGSMAGYGPPSSPGSGGYEPAIMPTGPYTPSFTPPIGMPDLSETMRTAGNSARDRIARYVAVSIRAADGAQDARYQRSLIGLNQVELRVAQQKFIERSRKDGRLGFIRLGVTQLGMEAYEIADKSRLMVPFCAPNDFVAPDKRAAYVNFAIASYCDPGSQTRANDWLLAVAGYEGYSEEQKASMQADAANYLAGEPRACAVQLVDAPVSPGGDDDCYYEDDCVGSPVDDPPPEPEPGKTCDTPPDFDSRRSDRMSDEERRSAEARWYLACGDAALSGDDIPRARELWQKAIDRGRRYGAQPSITAQKRLQSYTLTCYPRDRNLKRMSHDYVALQGDLVDMRALQQALFALGHYDGPTNGSLGPLTRGAIRKFQREMAFDETDTLTPRQTVYVICNAAQIARDPSSQNILGIMYATGLGVRLNVDLALEWLRTSSGRRYDKATYHLAVIYGTGIVLKSYRLCDIPRNLEQADQYLREAAAQGNGDAIAAWRKYGHKSPEGRWRAIEDELLANPTFAKAKADLTDIGKTCEKRYEPGPRNRDVGPTDEPAPAPAAPPPPPSKTTPS
jgi:TPR repeat protein